MVIFSARESVDYQPLDGARQRLLTRGDYLRAQTSMQPEAASEEHRLVGRPYIYHRSARGLCYRYVIEPYLRFKSRSEADRMVELHVQALMLARDGTLLRASAFQGSMPSLCQRWNATLSGVIVTPLVARDNPELADARGRLWYSLRYDFILTNPRASNIF